MAYTAAAANLFLARADKDSDFICFKYPWETSALLSLSGAIAHLWINAKSKNKFEGMSSAITIGAMIMQLFSGEQGKEKLQKFKNLFIRPDGTNIAEQNSFSAPLMNLYDKVEQNPLRASAVLSTVGNVGYMGAAMAAHRFDKGLLASGLLNLFGNYYQSVAGQTPKPTTSGVALASGLSPAKSL